MKLLLCRNGPPSYDYFKLNTNGSVKRELNRAAIGVVLQNDKGKWIWAFSAGI